MTTGDIYIVRETHPSKKASNRIKIQIAEVTKSSIAYYILDTPNRGDTWRTSPEAFNAEFEIMERLESIGEQAVRWNKYKGSGDIKW